MNPSDRNRIFTSLFTRDEAGRGNPTNWIESYDKPDALSTM